MAFERVGGEEIWQGTIAGVRRDRFRHDDGEEVTREIVSHPGAVAVVAHDERQLYLVTQPREAVGHPALLELPAGKRDAEGETPLDTARRELAEEIGKTASDWSHLVTFFASPGFSNEEIHVYLATGLSDAQGVAAAEEEERLELVTVPLEELDGVIEDCRDAKTLIGLLWFRAFRARPA